MGGWVGGMHGNCWIYINQNKATQQTRTCTVKMCVLVKVCVLINCMHLKCMCLSGNTF